MRIPIPLLLLLALKGHAEISSSFELNCDFSTMCRWRNVSGSEDSGDWVVSTLYGGDALHMITPRSTKESYFAYTSGFMGRTTALLVSEVVSCQLGGGNIKYWYFKTGTESQLEICTRQPPGSMDPSSFKCYDGLSPNFAKQWIFRVIELPPLSQPFELIFRGTFYPPMDVIALTDIEYNSALCDDRNHLRRKKRLTPHVIGFNDWQQIRHSERYKGETMIIVAQPSKNTKSMESLTTKAEPEEEIRGPHTHALDSTTLPSTTSTSTIPLVKTTLRAATTTSTTALDLPVPTTLATTTTTDSVANFMHLLREAAPVLPYIPLFVRSLQSGNIADSVVSNVGQEQPLSVSSNLVLKAGQHVRRSPISPSHIYNKDPVAAPPSSAEPSLVELAKQFGLLGEEDLLTTVSPSIFTRFAEILTTVSPMRNVFRMAMTTKRPGTLSTIYPARLVHTNEKRRNRPLQAKSQESGPLNQEEIEKLHSELFKRDRKTSNLTTAFIKTATQKPSRELVIFKKPTRIESEVATKLTELTKYLPSGIKDNLEFLREIPDIEGLTRGMDLSLVSKPGGFAKLKKQFVDRLMRRTIGLPDEDIAHEPSPLLAPIRVTHKMMRQQSQISNSGAEQSAGGSFGPEENNSNLVNFSEGNDLDIVSFNQPPFGSDLRPAFAFGSPPRALNFAAPTAEHGPEQNLPRVGAAFTPSCPLIDCTFDDNTFCNYVTSIGEQDKINGSLREWSISSSPILNSLTGVPHDLSKTGSFLYAGGTRVSPQDTFILSTKVPVEISEPARLDFFVYQAGVKGRLQVCLNTISNCALNIKGSTIDNKAQRWKNYHVPVSTTTHAIHFVADGLQDNYAIGLDHIQLLNKYGMAAQQCK